MKNKMEMIGALLFLAGIIILALAFITSIGLGLYWWAHTMALPQAAWAGFMVWVNMIFGGLGLLLGGFMLGDGK